MPDKFKNRDIISHATLKRKKNGCLLSLLKIHNLSINVYILSMGGALYPRVCGVSVCCLLFEDEQIELRECLVRLIFPYATSWPVRAFSNV